jgi:hypothetical protein
MSYRITKVVILSVLALYFVIALSAQGKNQDPYPIFSWSLFSDIPNPRNEFTIELHRYGDEVYDPPLRFSELSFLFDKLKNSPTEYTPRFTKLAEAIERRDMAEAERVQEEIAKMFMGKPYEYELIQVRVDAVEYWKTGHYDLVKSIATVDSEP